MDVLCTAGYSTTKNDTANHVEVSSDQAASLFSTCSTDRENFCSSCCDIGNNGGASNINFDSYNNNNYCKPYSSSKTVKKKSGCRECCLRTFCKGGQLKTSTSPEMKTLLQGLNEPGDSSNPMEPPDWLERELFDKGRLFYQKYLFSIFFSDLLSLIMMFSMSRILRPLIYTGRSDTPERALKRYVSTILHIVTWYTGDVWDPQSRAHKDLASIRSVHKRSADIFNSSDNYDKVQCITVEDKGHRKPRCPMSSALCTDLAAQSKPGLCLESEKNPPLYISQWDMAVTQYSFIGIILVYPKKMGAWGATEAELEGLVHFWRGIGWLLGIEDKYNFCKGTLQETQALCREMEELVIAPCLSRADWNHEHMSLSLMQGINLMVPGLSYPAMFRFLAYTLDFSIPTFVSKMSLKHCFQYWLMRFVLHIVFLIPGINYAFNELLKQALQIVHREHTGWFQTTELDFKVSL